MTMRVMIVDDERMATEELYDICVSHHSIREAVTFDNPADALVFIAQNSDVDIAFLDIEMPIMTGLDLAKRINTISSDTKIVFVTGFKEYAYDAYQVNAIGYILKPYDDDAVFNEIEKAQRMSDTIPKKEVSVKTFGYFDIFVNNKPVYFSSAKAKEFMALLVDRQGGAVSTEQAVSALWPDREYDETVQSLFRKMLKSLRASLSDAGISDIFVDVRNQRSIDVSKFSCDYYKFIENPRENVDTFHGEYMTGYAFAKPTAVKIRNKFYEIKGI